MKKNHLNIIGQIAIIILAIIVLLSACLSSNQAMPTFCVPQRFEGEYSLDNGITWDTLNDNTSLSALDGNLILRGNFEYELVGGNTLNFYLNHINMNIFINGELSFIDSRTEMGLTTSGCCKQWMQWLTPEVSKDDVVEIHLENPHKFGNKNAYNEFLNSIYGGPMETLKRDMAKSGLPNRIIGFTLIVIAIMLLAVALAFKLMQISDGNTIKNLGLLALFFGGYFILDAIDISLLNYLNVFNTYGLYICIVLATFWIVIVINESIQSKVKKVTNVILLVSTLINIILLLISLFGIMVIYDTKIYWISANLVIFIILLGCCIYEYYKCTKKDYIVLISNILLVTSVIFDMINAITEWFPLGALSKGLFLILFLINLIRIVRVVPKNYRMARQTEKMKAELADNRIAITLSQIKPHFLYNILNIIYYLCEKDTKIAQETIADFSNYLRGNMDALTQKNLIPFSNELEHLKKYISLEKRRFDDIIEVTYDIQTENFMLPALTVQPLVENAIKHGIYPLENGGIVKVSSRECKDCFQVQICDNGVGFDINEVKHDNKNHVGIENVKNRLWNMCKASLEITSEKNKGTTATIKIPKKNKPLKI